MASNTTYYSLIKPAVGEAADITKINTNMDTIDATMKSISDTASAKQSKMLLFTNKSASSWSADSTYEDYPYKCNIACSGVTASDVAEVVFSPEQATSGEYAPVCLTYSGGVRIYASVNTSITIPHIIVHKG
ncbi:MAG: hypothetical protein E7Z65_06465 [Thermoplasmata archaeon]|nr:hypothetical protein [Thermoplasmata archaeon]